VRYQVHIIVIESKIVGQQVQQLLCTQEDQEISLWTRKKVKALELNIHLKMLEDRKATVNNVLEIALNMLDNTPMINR